MPIKLRSQEYLELTVPGLAEKRPSVIVGDEITFKKHDTFEVAYGGIIKKVTEETVWIGGVDQRLFFMIIVDSKLFCISVLLELVE